VKARRRELPSLADIIEDYINSLIAEGEGVAEIQRALLAEMFRCAPSQISYVITSRFSPEKGFIIESRRGGGGYIRLRRVNLEDDDIRQLIRDIGEYVSQQEAYGYLDRLRDEGFMDDRTYHVMRAALSRNVLLMALPSRDMIRANVLKAMLNAYFSVEPEDEKGE